MRFWSPGFIIGEFEKLAELGVRDAAHLGRDVLPQQAVTSSRCSTKSSSATSSFRMWSYSRDGHRPAALPGPLPQAGIDWLALGVEAGNQMIRHEVSKGSFKDVNIRQVAQTIREHGLNIIANYIFGFPEDTIETMQQTLDLALELNTEMANMYPCQALPGSPLYYLARANGWKPCRTPRRLRLPVLRQPAHAHRQCSAAQVLRFRDEAWQKYFTNPAFLNLVERKFGPEQRRNVEAMASVRLRRKLLGDPPPEVAAGAE